MDARIERVVAWLFSLRDTLPDNDVVVVVSHGGTISLTLRAVLSAADPLFYYGSTDNTSVTSLVQVGLRPDVCSARIQPIPRVRCATRSDNARAAAVASH